ncbi:MAG: DUF481 domain-containing protein [Gammaproteobacteria bacterium]|nr:DUF481 domain-containing protein [Gammaproteobacteria bacterium]
MRLLILGFSSFLFSQVWADDSSEQESPWKGKAELGIVDSSGNTNNSSTNGKVNVTYEAEKWKQEFRLETYKAESEVEENGVKVVKTTADRTYFYAKSGYKYTEKSYTYALVDYADENFTSYDYIANFSLGYGRVFFKDKEKEFDGEIGYGLRRFQEKQAFLTQEEEVIRLAANYKQSVSSNAVFQQEFVFEFGEEFDVYKSVSALSVNINSSMALSLGYEVQHNTEVDPGFENTDRKAIVNLVYNFL